MESVAVEETRAEPSVHPITEDLHRQLACYCFSNLEHFLTNKKMQEYEAHFDALVYPLFVSYYLKDRLRGCLGTFREDKLGKSLQSYSIIAAFKDQRFPPIQE